MTLMSALLIAGAHAQTATPIFVLNSLDANISVIDPITWKVVKTLPTGKEPHHLYLTPDEKSVIVANAASDSLTFIDPRTAEIQRVVRNTIDPYHLIFAIWATTQHYADFDVQVRAVLGEKIEATRGAETALTAHLVHDRVDTAALICEAQAVAKRYAIGHTTLQLETEPLKYIPEALRHRKDEGAVRVNLNRPMSEILAELRQYPVTTRLLLSGPIVVAGIGAYEWLIASRCAWRSFMRLMTAWQQLSTP